jgi:hypothetical protein
MFTIGGKQVPVSEVKPGMSGTATITTTTTVTPVLVTEVRDGEVLQATGNSLLIKGRTASGCSRPVTCRSATSRS